MEDLIRIASMFWNEFVVGGAEVIQKALLLVWGMDVSLFMAQVLLVGMIAALPFGLVLDLLRPHGARQKPRSARQYYRP